MLTGRAAELRPDINDLAPTVVVLVEMGPSLRPYRRSGEFAFWIKSRCRARNLQLAAQKAARPRKPGAIPTSGRARSDAKRNARLTAHQEYLARRG